MVRRILMIDDDRLQFRLTQQHFRAFRGERFELEWAPTYEEGLVRLLMGDCAACLLDYQLGPRDGLALIREAVEKGCVTPIVFLTAESSAAVDTEAMHAGALDYLVKGEITPATLERSLRYALKLSGTLAELRRLATRDELTGLLNRRELDRILQDETGRALRFGRSFSLVLLDLDHFKAINDEYGHPAGDAVLGEVARRLQGAARNVDRVARFGGEEIAVVLLELEGGGAFEAAQRLVEAVRREPVAVAGEGGVVAIKVTISAGVATLPAQARDPAGLIGAADRALYAAKRAGRDRAVAAVTAGG